MSSPTWVLDTNVVVSGLLSAHGHPAADDLPFLEVAYWSSDQTLVTGNLRHYPPASRGPVNVLSPREAWEQLRKRSA